MTLLVFKVFVKSLDHFVLERDVVGSFSFRNDFDVVNNVSSHDTVVVLLLVYKFKNLSMLG